MRLILLAPLALMACNRPDKPIAAPPKSPGVFIPGVTTDDIVVTASSGCWTGATGKTPAQCEQISIGLGRSQKTTMTACEINAQVKAAQAVQAVQAAAATAQNGTSKMALLGKRAAHEAVESAIIPCHETRAPTTGATL